MKIKKVEIQAFKSYLRKEDGTFDFTLPASGVAANFSSIYAPNGFGKTSFFDAVDYAITGKIGRFSRDVSLRNRYEQDAQRIREQGKRLYLLRNKDAGTHDTNEQVDPLTEISVYTSHRIEPFITDYNIPRRGSSDYNFRRECKPENKFFEKMLLSQEAIDAFLRETTPEKRYEKFVEAVGDLSGEDKKRRTLLAVKDDLKKAEAELSKGKEKCSEDLAAAKNRENPIEEANRLIAEINQIAKVPLLPFNAQHNQALHDELLVQLVSLEEQLSSSASELNEKKASAERQQTSLLETQRNVERLSKLRASETYLNQTIEDAERIAELESKKKAVQSEIDQFNEQLKDAKQFQSQISEFVEQQSKLRKLEQEQRELDEKIKSVETKKREDETDLKLKRVESGKAKEELERLQLESEKAGESFKELSELKAERDKLNLQLKDYDPRQLQSRINDLEQKLEQLSALEIGRPIQKDIFELFEESDRKSLLEAQEKYNEVDSKRLLAETQLENTKQRLSETKGQAGEIRTLIELASSIVANSQQSACPVCQQDYETSQLLQRRIADNPVLGTLEKELTQNFQGLKKQICSYDETLKEHEQRFNRIVGDQKVLSERMYEESKREQTNQKAQHEHTVKSFEQNADQIRNLSEKLLNKSEEEHQQFIAGKIEGAKQRVTTISLHIEKAEEALDSSVSALTAYEEEQSRLTLRKEQQELLAETFGALRNYLESLAVSLDESESELKEFFGAQQVNWSEKYDGAKLTLAELERQISQLFERRSVEDHESSYEDLVKKRSEVVSQVIALNEELALFYELMKQMNMTVPEDATRWGQCKDAIESYISQQVAEIEKLSKAQRAMRSLKKISEMAVEFRDPQMLQRQLEELNEKVKAHELLIDSLQADVENISAYIRETTDAYFRTGLINQLYSSIDPHPEFKRIQFECNMDGDRPQLNISAAESADSDQVSPTLTFSSAQINVLSLSIFLAQALTTKDNDGNDVDCIFIDDPVQSVDSINSLSFIDLMRALCLRFDKQIIVSTHDENFHELMKKKIPSGVLPAKYLKLASFGKVVDD
ncbi:AAA family ATPase [uncultured Desulfuromusa sp.]|uniref:AAA family ATPase n=1 Tax=uncultured Desulfuromusa sp. TaxID=219183 RepID=UPI002AA66177|nr:AAA family ATPase [uncultured Desulfuromusa sp.]